VRAGIKVFLIQRKYQTILSKTGVMGKGKPKNLRKFNRPGVGALIVMGAPPAMGMLELSVWVKLRIYSQAV
jgi:hypothetical protein